MPDESLEDLADDLLRSLGLLDEGRAGTVSVEISHLGLSEERFRFRSRVNVQGFVVHLIDDDEEHAGTLAFETLSPDDMHARAMFSSRCGFALGSAPSLRSTDIATCYDGSSTERLTLWMEPARGGAPSKAYYECGHDPGHYFAYETGANSRRSPSAMKLVKQAIVNLPALLAVVAAVGIVLLDDGHARKVWVCIAIAVVGLGLLFLAAGFAGFAGNPKSARWAVECGAILKWAGAVLVSVALIALIRAGLPKVLPGKEREEDVKLPRPPSPRTPQQCCSISSWGGTR